MNSQNPLAAHFRVPGIHTVIPSGGTYVGPEDIEMSVTGELEVYPMTAKDEVWAKNPDGLLNGYSIENIIKSCVPGVKNPRKMPAVDIDYLLLAIKKATFGPTMTITAKCPKCGNEHDFQCPIDDIMGTMRPLPRDVSVRLSDDLIVYLRPHNYEATIKTNLAAFEETKLLQVLLMNDWSEEQRVKTFSNSFSKVSNLNLELISDCIVSISSRGAIVDNPRHIAEFIQNAPREFYHKINDALEQFKTAGFDKTIEIQCPKEECQHVWSTDLIFDPAHFFA